MNSDEQLIIQRSPQSDCKPFLLISIGHDSEKYNFIIIGKLFNPEYPWIIPHGRITDRFI